MGLGPSEISAIMQGGPVPLGVLVSAGASVTNQSTASAFGTSPTLAGRALTLQATGEGFFKIGTSSSVAATTAADGSSFKLAADQSVSFVMPTGYTHIAWIATTSANCKVWENTTP